MDELTGVATLGSDDEVSEITLCTSLDVLCSSFGVDFSETDELTKFGAITVGAPL